jgi:hypothetical protein
MKWIRVPAALALFGVAFAYVEAAVVVYLRAVEEPIRREASAGGLRDEVFPLLTVEQLKQAGPEHFHLLLVELGRELATLVTLAAAGLAVARNFRQWLAGFMIAFGVWDVFYYVFLKLLINWPDSLWTWDILFLLPVVWVGPVISPLLVAVSMVVAGTITLWRESAGRPIRFRWFHWAAIFGGGLVLVLAFCWDHQNTSAGGWPNPFNWPLFACGLAIGLTGFVHALRAGPKVVRQEAGA